MVRNSQRDYARSEAKAGSAERDIGLFLRLEDTPIELASLPSAEAVFAVATRHSLTFYDASYLELAIRERIALATLDQHLARAAAAEGVPLIGT